MITISIVANWAVMFVRRGTFGSSSFSIERMPTSFICVKSPWRAKHGMSCFVSRVRSQHVLMYFAILSSVYDSFMTSSRVCGST